VWYCCRLGALHLVSHARHVLHVAAAQHDLFADFLGGQKQSKLTVRPSVGRFCVDVVLDGL
jgi:hypothetical protein